VKFCYECSSSYFSHPLSYREVNWYRSAPLWLIISYIFLTVNTHNNQAICINITLIPQPVSSVYAHHQEGYIQFKMLLYKMTNSIIWVYHKLHIHILHKCVVVYYDSVFMCCVSVYCLYTRSIYYSYCYVRPHISCLIHFLCAASCVFGPFFDVKIIVESFSIVWKSHTSTSWGHVPLTYYVNLCMSWYGNVVLLVDTFLKMKNLRIWLLYDY
jgi:hypothetical protein